MCTEVEVLAKNEYNWTLAAIWSIGLKIFSQLTVSWLIRDDVWFSAKSTFQASKQSSTVEKTLENAAQLSCTKVW